MGRTKKRLQSNQPTLGGWIMIGHPVVAEVLAGEGFDWLAVDMEHTATDIRTFQEIALALKGTSCDLLARLPCCDPHLAKLVLDAGATGIIVPSVNTPEQAQQAVAMAKFPPEGTRGASLCRATDFGRNFETYYREHNQRVIVVVMLEHVDAVENVDAILQTPGIDATFIGPYDLSASLGKAGELNDPEVVAAQQRILGACRAHGVAAGIHVVPIDPQQVRQRVAEGFCFVACGLDTGMLIHGCRTMLRSCNK